MNIDNCLHSFITNSLFSTYFIVDCKIKILFYVTVRFLLRRMLFIFLHKVFIGANSIRIVTNFNAHDADNSTKFEELKRFHKIFLNS